MRITRVTPYVVKVPHHERFFGEVEAPSTFPGTDYYFEGDWNEVYSQQTESTFVHIETDKGIDGWGECQAPIVPEIAATLIERLLGPMILDRDPRESEKIWDRMYTSLNGRGQVTGFMLDAMAGIDIAVWDIRGKEAGEPIYKLLGEPLRTKLPLYLSALRAPTNEERAEIAAEALADGYEAIKLYLGRGLDEDIAQARIVRDRVGDKGRLLSDTFWTYTYDGAVHLGQQLYELGVEWLEAPLPPEDSHGHSQLIEELEISVAVGECLRTRWQFAEWFDKKAIDIAQPDVARCGITEAQRIAELARAHDIPVAFHLGVCLGIGVAATWHLAAVTPNFYIQEHEPTMLELTNEFLSTPLRLDSGQGVVPDGPGLGVEVDLNRLNQTIERFRR